MRWGGTLLAGALLSFSLVWLATSYTQHLVAHGGLAEWDRQIIVDAEKWPISFTDGIILESPGNIMILGPVTLLAASVCFRLARTIEGLTILLCYGIARMLIWTGWHLWERARPDIIADGAAALSAHSFPSGHALLCFTTYGLLAAFWWRGRSLLDRFVAIGLLLAIAFVVGMARLRLGAHWPSDVIAGWILGSIWLGCCLMALRLAGPNPNAPPT